MKDIEKFDPVADAIDAETGEWNVIEYFRRLLPMSRLATENKFTFCEVSSLQGFEDALAQMTSSTAFFAVSDDSDGTLQLNNTPRTSRVYTVFLAMRHKATDNRARHQRLRLLRQLTQQLASVILLHRWRLSSNKIYVQPEIRLKDVDRYFFSGAACAFFSIRVDINTDLSFKDDEWT